MYNISILGSLLTDNSYDDRLRRHSTPNLDGEDSRLMLLRVRNLFLCPACSKSEQLDCTASLTYSVFGDNMMI